MPRVWKINDSGRPAEELEPLLAAALGELEAVGGITGSLAIRFRRGRGARSGGHAGSRHLGHEMPKLAGRAEHYVSLDVPESDDPADYGRAAISGHAKRNGRELGSWYDEQYDAGVRRVGRWPLVRTRGWREETVHTLGHELFHVLQFDRCRAGISEVDCEVFAERVLAAYRLQAAEAAGH